MLCLAIAVAWTLQLPPQTGPLLLDKARSITCSVFTNAVDIADVHPPIPIGRERTVG